MEFEYKKMPVRYLYPWVITFGIVIYTIMLTFGFMLGVAVRSIGIQIFFGALIVLVVVGGIIHLRKNTTPTYTMQVTVESVEPDDNAVDPRVIVTFGNEKGSGVMELEPRIVDAGDRLMLIKSASDENKIRLPMKRSETVKVLKVDDDKVTPIYWVVATQK